MRELLILLFLLIAVPAQSANTIKEITIAAPDLLMLVIMDDEVQKGPLVGPLKVPDKGAPGTILYPRASDGFSGRAAQIADCCGYWLKFMDLKPSTYLDRATADNPSSWSIAGSEVSVTAVYRRTEPNQFAFHAGRCPACVQELQSSMIYYVYLKLNSKLPNGGPYTLKIRGNTVPETAFTHSDKVTRSASIRGTLLGFRPNAESKLSYLAVKVPSAPNWGAINFIEEYGLKTFHIIDDGGAIQYTGPIVQRIAPDTIEYNAYPRNIRYVDTYNPAVITGVTQANPGVVTTAARHNLSNGDIVSLYAVGGMIQLGGYGAFYRANNVTPTSFELQTQNGANVDTSKFSAWSGSYYDTPNNGVAYRTYLANRSATYVYELNFSTWRPERSGFYRVYVPGLGVGDKFEINDDIYLRAAKLYACGEYNQRNGIALDGRCGYTRPVALRDGVGSVKIYRSKLPMIATSEDCTTKLCAPSINAYTYAALGSRPERMTGYYGLTADAGDWDSSLHAHLPAYISLLDLGYDYLSTGNTTDKSAFVPMPGRESLNFGLPKSSEILDPVLYAGTDKLPDPIHQAIWYLDSLRRTQRPDGGVASGMGELGGSGARCRPGQASFLCSRGVWLYAADHATSFQYAAGAARLAKILKELGFTSLASVYETSAKKAWAFSETLYQSHNGDKVARDAYYLGDLEYTSQFWSNYVTMTPSNVSTIFNTFTIGRNFTVSGGNGTIATGMRVRVEDTMGDTIDDPNTGALPGGLKAGVYYIRVVSGTTVTFHPTEADSNNNTNIVDLTSSGTGAGGRVGMAYTRAAYESLMANFQSQANSSRSRNNAIVQLWVLTNGAEEPWITVMKECQTLPTRNAAPCATDVNLMYNYTRAPSPPVDNALRNSLLGGAGGIGNAWVGVTGGASYAAGVHGFRSLNYATNQSIVGAQSSYQAQRYYDYCTRQNTACRGGPLAPIVALNDHLAFVLGANQQGKSIVNGHKVLGFPKYRTYCYGTLHEDSFYQGLDCSPDGIHHYWLANAHNSLGLSFNFATGPNSTGTLSFTGLTNRPGFGIDGAAKVVSPNPYSWAAMEYVIQNREIVFQMEYTFHQTMIPMQTLAMWLHVYDRR